MNDLQGPTDLPPQERLLAIMAILDERKNQDERWGQQNHNPVEWIAILTEEVGEAAKEAIGHHWATGETTQDTYSEQLRIELIQVAAVAVAAIESLDRNELREEEDR